MTDEVDDCLRRPSLGCQVSSPGVAPAGLGSSTAKETFECLRPDESLLSFVLAAEAEASAAFEFPEKNPFFVVLGGAVSGETSDPGLWVPCPGEVDDSMINRRGRCLGSRRIGFSR